MSTDNLPALHSVKDIETIADKVAKSRLYGLTEPQAFTLMLLAQAKGLHPIQAFERYHVLHGRPTMKADAMLAEFQAHGGTIEWVTKTNVECKVIFTHPVQAPKGVTSEFSIEDARQAELFSNDLWRKYPGNMLRARVISNGIRMVMPGILSGIYTPEEVSDFDDRPRPIMPGSEMTHGCLISGEMISPGIEVSPGPPPEVEPPLGRPQRKDTRSWAEITAAGVDRTNTDWKFDNPETEDIVVAFQVDRHMLTWAVENDMTEDPGNVRAGEVRMILKALYADEDNVQLMRNEIARYLAQKLREAREKAMAEQEGDDFGNDVADADAEPVAAGAEAEPDEPGTRG